MHVIDEHDSRDLKEAVRVLKPGGSVEIIEEDIIFPCPDSPINRTPRASPVLRSRASRSHSGASRLAEFSDDDTYEDFFDDYYSSSKSRSIDTISGAYNDQVLTILLLSPRRDLSRFTNALSSEIIPN